MSADTATGQLDADVVARMIEIAERPETADRLLDILECSQKGAAGESGRAPPCRPRRGRAIAASKVVAT